MAGDTNFPSTLDSHTGGDPFGFAVAGDHVITTLTATAAAGDTTLTVADNTDFPTRGILCIDNEVITYTGVSSTTGFTGCTRGAYGTTAAAHANGARVGQTITAAMINDLAAAIVAIQTQLGAGFAATGSIMRKIDEKNGTGASGTISFTGIPQIYRALKLHICGRSTDASLAVGTRMTFEASPTAGAYNSQRFSAAATVTGASELIGTVDRIDTGGIPAASSPANCYSGTEITIPEYRNTSMFKTVHVLDVYPADLASGGLVVQINGGVWESTAAIDQIHIALSAGNWTAASRISLWGIPA